LVPLGDAELGFQSRALNLQIGDLLLQPLITIQLSLLAAT